MKQTKKWLAGLLCAVLLAGLLPMAAFAEGDDPEQSAAVSLTAGGELTTAGNYVLNSDLRLNENLTIKASVTLNLNGHTLTGNSGGPVITILNGGSLTLNDSVGTGKITGGKVITETKPYDQAGGVTVDGNSSFIMNGGSITGNDIGEEGGSGGVHIVGGSFFTMNGGSITGNTGSGLTVSTNSTATIGNGTISGNEHTVGNGCGGGAVVIDGTLIMNGGTISNNTANDGGGVYVAGSNGGKGGTFTMSGGYITNNTATSYGGGVVVCNGENAATFTMSGGSITGNTATGYGGGVVLSDGNATFTVSGAANITGNTVSGAANNVWLSSGKMITASSLTTGAKIGVTPGGNVDLSNVETVTVCTGTAETSYFSSDNTSYEVAEGSNSVVLKVKSTETDPENPDPTDGLTRAQFALMIYQHESFGLTGETKGPTFTDVGDCTAEEKNAIGVLADKGILTGTSQNTFNPGDTLTRGQAATAIYRAADSPTNGTIEVPEISDVTDSGETQWYYNAIRNLYAIGVLDTSDISDSKFNPNNSIDTETLNKWLGKYDTYKNSGGTTDPDDPKLPDGVPTRAEFAEIIQKHTAFGLAGLTGASTFSDVTVENCTAEQINAIGVLANKNILNGTQDGIFAPKDGVNRSMAAVAIWRAAGSPKLGAAGNLPFKDITADSWYYDAVSNLYAMGVVKAEDAVGENFAIEQYITKTELQTWLSRYDTYKNPGGTTDPGTDPNPNPGGGGGVYVPPSSTTTTTTTNPDGSTTTTTTDHSTGIVTEVTKNPDGSTTTTVKKPDGTCTETIENPGGSELVKETRPDGSSETKITTPDGSTGTTTVDKDGQVTADVELKLPDLNMGEEANPVAPVPELPVTTDREKAPVVTIGLPGDITIRVEIPVKDVTPGTVAVMVNADGSETVVKTSLTTESGVTVTVSDGATVKIMDNSKQFSDVPEDHWASGAVDFASSRELLNGTSATEAAFSPEADMTRAMLMTVLARFDGVDTEGGSVWYERGMEWAKASGVSDGTAPNSSITREQMVVMMYRYAGSPAASGSLDGFTDANEVSDYALDAMRWAVGTGIIGGMGGGVLSPGGNATRAQVAAVLTRYVQNLAK